MNEPRKEMTLKEMIDKKIITKKDAREILNLLDFRKRLTEARVKND